MLHPCIEKHDRRSISMKYTHQCLPSSISSMWRPQILGAGVVDCSNLYGGSSASGFGPGTESLTSKLSHCVIHVNVHLYIDLNGVYKITVHTYICKIFTCTVVSC